MFKFIQKPNKIIAKKYIYDTFDKSFIIPTVLYPLQSEKFKAFTKENTEILKDKKIIEIIDSCEWKNGYCYLCHEDLYKKLIQNGIDAKYYVGWHIKANFPIHHAWVVVEDKYLIDLSSDYLMFRTLFSEDSQVAKKYLADFNKTSIDELTLDESRKMVVDYTMSTKNEKNSVRCSPLGYVISDQIIYVGCESTAIEGQKEFADLMNKYPNHEAYRHINKITKMGKTRQMLTEAGYYN